MTQPIFDWNISAGTILDGLMILLGGAAMWGSFRQGINDMKDKQREHEADIRENRTTVQNLTLNMTRLAMAQENTEKNIGSLTTLIKDTIVARLAEKAGTR